MNAPEEEPGESRGQSPGILLLFLLLLALGTFGVWNARRSAAKGGTARAAEAGLAGEALPPGWGAFVVGRPSGAAPIQRDPTEGFEIVEGTRDGLQRPRVEPEVPTPATQEEYELSTVSDFELVVAPGQVLSRIVQVYYGAAEPDLVQSLAEYNGLSSPDMLRAGTTVRLPSERRLRALAASRDG